MSFVSNRAVARLHNTLRKMLLLLLLKLQIKKFPHSLQERLFQLCAYVLVCMVELRAPAFRRTTVLCRGLGAQTLGHAVGEPVPKGGVGEAGEALRSPTPAVRLLSSPSVHLGDFPPPPVRHPPERGARVVTQLMWQAVRAGESRAYAYLGWMYHHGHIGGDDPSPEERPPPYGGWQGPKSEEEMLGVAAERWGAWVLDKAYESRSRDDAKGGGGRRRDRTQDAGEFAVRPGEDIWGGAWSDDVVFDWVLMGGGVWGANRAAELYREGSEVSRSSGG